MAAFQLNQVLYLCGGKYPRRDVFCGQLLTKSSLGKTDKQPPMSIARSCVGFSGQGTDLVAVGGRNESGPLSVFESYSLDQKKWTTRANLNLEREWPGVCIFSSKDVYCFCGFKGKALKSVEKFSILSESKKWIKLQKTEVEASYHLKAFQFQDEILLFGGYYQDKKVVPMMELVTKQGKVLDKGKYSPLLQGRFPCVVYKKAIFSVFSSQGKEVIQSYDGKKWRQEEIRFEQ